MVDTKKKCVAIQNLVEERTTLQKRPCLQVKKGIVQSKNDTKSPGIPGSGSDLIITEWNSPFFSFDIEVKIINIFIHHSGQ